MLAKGYVPNPPIREMVSSGMKIVDPRRRLNQTTTPIPKQGIYSKEDNCQTKVGWNINLNTIVLSTLVQEAALYSAYQSSGESRG